MQSNRQLTCFSTVYGLADRNSGSDIRLPMSQIRPDGICKYRGERRGPQPWFTVDESSIITPPPNTVRLTHPNPSQVIPIPFILRGNEFTGSARRMQKTPAPDYSTQGFVERYKSAGYGWCLRRERRRPAGLEGAGRPAARRSQRCRRNPDEAVRRFRVSARQTAPVARLARKCCC